MMRPPNRSSLRVLLAALAALAAASALGGCCDLRESTLRCGACCYDNCIIPMAAAPDEGAAQLVPAPRPRLAGAAREMAY